MDYLVYLFLNDLIHIEEETRFINGKEEVCLIIPTRTNQIKRTNRGRWLMIFNLAECKPNAKMITHDVQLMYIHHEDIAKHKLSGVHDRTARMGRVYVRDKSPEKKIDRSNKSTDINCFGRIVISDIPTSLIFKNVENDKRYVTHLVFKGYGESNRIYTGFLCIDDIPPHDLFTDLETGKKYIEVVFKKLPILDTYMNTHQLIIAKKDGSEIEIGRFKEWIKDNPTSTPDKNANEEEHTTTITPRPVPKSIDGIKF